MYVDPLWYGQYEAWLTIRRDMLASLTWDMKVLLLV